MNWHDKRDETMLSTIHKGEMKDSSKVVYKIKQPIMKPDAVIDYNENMCLIDKSDTQTGIVECIKNCKMVPQIFWHLTDVSLLNVYNIYIIKTGKKLN